MLLACCAGRKGQQKLVSSPGLLQALQGLLGKSDTTLQAVAALLLLCLAERAAAPTLLAITQCPGMVASLLDLVGRAAGSSSSSCGIGPTAAAAALWALAGAADGAASLAGTSGALSGMLGTVWQLSSVAGNIGSGQQGRRWLSNCSLNAE